MTSRELIIVVAGILLAVLFVPMAGWPAGLLILLLVLVNFVRERWVKG